MSSIDQTVSSIDHLYLELCFLNKSRLSKGPLHSNFKVYSIITFTLKNNNNNNIINNNEYKLDNPYYAISSKVN
jgi:hypothetical protein